MKDKFCVGDLVDLRPFMFRRSVRNSLLKKLEKAYRNNPHRVVETDEDGNHVRIDANGLELLWLHSGAIELAHKNSVAPIDDLIKGVSDGILY